MMLTKNKLISPACPNLLSKVLAFPLCVREDASFKLAAVGSNPHSKVTGKAPANSVAAK